MLHYDAADVKTSVAEAPRKAGSSVVDAKRPKAAAAARSKSGSSLPQVPTTTGERLSLGLRRLSHQDRLALKVAIADGMKALHE